MIDLRLVTKPGRYSGGEWNSVIKDWDSAEIKVAFAYPDLYEIGMSSLAIPLLYEILNQKPEIAAERVFAPWKDMEEYLRRERLPLFSLESKHPLRDFDIFGFSLGYELTYTNVLNMLDLAGIPLRSRERRRQLPLIIAGGSCALNPEPMAEFIDLFILGDGEEVILEFLALFGRWLKEAKSIVSKGEIFAQTKEELLLQAAKIEGIYVPSLYTASYTGEGFLNSLVPVKEGVPQSVKRRILERMLPPLARPIVPYIEVVHDRGAVEIQRGCTRGCRFCQAGTIYRPLRLRPKEEVLQAVQALLENCGYSEIALLSLSTSDYDGIEELIHQLHGLYHKEVLAISLPSLRVDSMSLPLMDSLLFRRKMNLTFAPEAGTERLRQAINKDLTDDEILNTTRAALERGWRNIKLYFMLGLPTETLEDVEGIPELVKKLSNLRINGKSPDIKASIATFVPKPHTPLQWCRQEPMRSIQEKFELIKKGLRKTGSRVSWQDAGMSYIEGTLSRGDRRISSVIYKAWERGSRFDAWTEGFKLENWLEAFSSSGLDLDFYVCRERAYDEVFPWSHIDTGIKLAYLKKEFLNTYRSQVTLDCREGACYACGLEVIHPGCHDKLASIKKPSGQIL